MIEFDPFELRDSYMGDLIKKDGNILKYASKS